jgi:hypothetical protein
VLAQVRDSLLTSHINERLVRRFASLERQINGLIRMTGLLDMQEAVPVLERKLPKVSETIREREREVAIRFALTRLGGEEQRQYVLDNLMYYPLFRRTDFMYFQDEEMMWRYVEVNFYSDKRVSILGDDGVSMSFAVIRDIIPFIKNLPQELELSWSIVGERSQNAWAQSVYDWLMENRDIVEFDFDDNKRWLW